MEQEYNLLKEQFINKIEIIKELGIPVIFDKSQSCDKQNALKQLNLEISNCKQCHLSNNKIYTVFGFGNPDAKLVFVGDFPGKNTDNSSKPFGKETGELLEKIVKAMGLNIKDVYVCNVFKCYNNSYNDLNADDNKACKDFLCKQLDIIKPIVICTMGEIATRALLHIDKKIDDTDDKIYFYHDIKVIPTLHPRTCLEIPENKKIVWEHMKKIMKLL
ncbi:uracil-DNA glycosylase [Candidatus Poribacteria bacterium]|nr:uracil-DNA glycosylase [Candidatus Poribacteria bacterium]